MPLDRQKLQKAMALLGLSQDSLAHLTSKGLRAQYHSRAKKAHPDKFQDEQEKAKKTREFQDLLDAWKLVVGYARDYWKQLGGRPIKLRRTPQWRGVELSAEAQGVFAHIEDILGSRSGVTVLWLYHQLRQVAEFPIDQRGNAELKDIVEILGIFSAEQLRKADRFLWQISMRAAIRTTVFDPISGGGVGDSPGSKSASGEERIGCVRCKQTGVVQKIVLCRALPTLPHPADCMGRCNGAGELKREQTCPVCEGRSVIWVSEDRQTCTRCAGNGFVAAEAFCVLCDGTGSKQRIPPPQSAPTVEPREVFWSESQPLPCPACVELVGHVDSTCPTCKGTGRRRQKGG